MLITALFGRMKVALFVLGAIGTLGAAAYFYYQDTQAKLINYAVAQEKLTVALDTQRETTTQLLLDIETLKEIISDLNSEFASSRQRVDELETTFKQNAAGKQRDIGELAEKRPGLIENRVNTATQEVFRCLELLSGSTPTLEELNNDNLKSCITTIID